MCLDRCPCPNWINCKPYNYRKFKTNRMGIDDEIAKWYSISFRQEKTLVDVIANG